MTPEPGDYVRITGVMPNNPDPSEILTGDADRTSREEVS